MNNEKEMTRSPLYLLAQISEQSSQNLTDNSLTDFDPDFKGADDDLYREITKDGSGLSGNGVYDYPL
ncbi:MAG: hypothetical protein ACLSHM_01275 [Vescimonas sp.]